MYYYFYFSAATAVADSDAIPMMTEIVIKTVIGVAAAVEIVTMTADVKETEKTVIKTAAAVEKEKTAIKTAAAVEKETVITIATETENGKKTAAAEEQRKPAPLLLFLILAAAKKTSRDKCNKSKSLSDNRMGKRKTVGVMFLPFYFVLFFFWG